MTLSLPSGAIIDVTESTVLSKYIINDLQIFSHIYHSRYIVGISYDVHMIYLPLYITCIKIMFPENSLIRFIGPT